MAAKTKVLLFFTDANPPTLAQVKLVQQVVDGYDAVWVIPNAATQKKARPLVLYQHRVNMARMAFENISHVVIVKESAKDQLTYHQLPLINSIARGNPHCSLDLMMGSDAFRRLQDEAKPAAPIDATDAAAAASTAPPLSESVTQVLVVKRGGVGAEEKQIGGAPVLEAKFIVRDTRSSALAVSLDPAFLIERSHPAVLRYVERKRLYALAEGSRRRKKPIREVLRNPTLDSIAELRRQAAALQPEHLLSQISPLLIQGLSELLKREVTDQSLEWLSQYLKLHNVKKVQAGSNVVVSKEVDGFMNQCDRIVW